MLTGRDLGQASAPEPWFSCLSSGDDGSHRLVHSVAGT
jgi:hypothetical protein